MDIPQNNKKLKIGCCFNARQSPGGNNIIDGLLDFAKVNNSQIYGFLYGTNGLLECNYIEVNEENFKLFRN